MAQDDYKQYTQGDQSHLYPDAFGDMDWSDYQNFDEAYKAYWKKHHNKSKFP